MWVLISCSKNDRWRCYLAEDSLGCPVNMAWSKILSLAIFWTSFDLCLSFHLTKRSTVTHCVSSSSVLWGHCCLSRIPTMPLFPLISSRLQPRAFVRSAAPLPSTPGSDQCSFSRSLVMRCAEPLGSTRTPILPPLEKPATSPIKPPSTGYTHPPSDLEQSSRIQTSSLTLCTQSPWRCQGETRKDCFLIAGKRKKGEGFWNI